MVHIKRWQNDDTRLVIDNQLGTGTRTAAGASLAIACEQGGYDPKIVFSIGGGGSDWCVGVDNSDSDTFVIAGGTDATALIETNPRLKINTSGVALEGSLFIGDSGGFTAANGLHDYEEGTFTPALSRTSLDVTYSSQAGKYTKIGNVVTVTIEIILTGVTASGSGNITLTGLPYNNGSTSAYSTVLKLGYNDIFGDNIQGVYITGTTCIFIPVGPTQSNYTGVVSTGYLGITGTYIANT